jgi:flavodoxin/predicted small secreted protein
MKKLAALLMSVMMVLLLAACGNTTDGAAEDTESSTVESEEADTTEDTSFGKTLVVYYSATNHTENVAGYIAKATDAETFEIVPVEEYSSADLDWTDDSSRVVYEHDNPDERDVELVETAVEDWDSYDTVFIGYPIWWGIAAWPVDSFVKANDFTGKTVIPFCTSSSSGLGESGSLLAEEAETGDWQEGMRFSSGASESEVIEWVAGLEF